MHLPSWIKLKPTQLDLLSVDATPNAAAPAPDAGTTVTQPAAPGNPLVLPLTVLCEDPNNPRTEFPDAELDELAQSIRQHGILQAIVVHPADAHGRYRIHFGAKRLRAAIRAGLQTVPVTLREAAPDPYAQVAENLKRHSLSPIDLARFIRHQVDAGDSNANVASKLNLDLTTVAHHLTLLNLPPVLDEALKSGRWTSPRTLHELHQLHVQNPDQFRALLTSNGDLNRKAIAAVKATALPIARDPDQKGRASAPLMAQDRIFRREVRTEEPGWSRRGVRSAVGFMVLLGLGGSSTHGRCSSDRIAC